jgi:hypothetical protein
MASANDSAQMCDFHSCNNKAIGQCKFCERYLCDFHLKPKHTGSRSYIGSLTDPYLINAYKIDNASDDGHPCPKYHEVWMTDYEKERERQKVPIDFDALDALMGHELTGDPNSCNVLACGNKPVHTCKICMKRYCAYHASRKASKMAQLGGHACVR